VSADPLWMTDDPDVIPVDGAQLLTIAETFIKRFCAFPDKHALVAVTLWAAHTHMVEGFHTTPRLALLSPEAGSGKTRVLEVLHLLVANSMFSLSASSAAIFRTLAQQQITLLFDEVDTIFQKRGKDDGNEDLRALLNAGYKRGASIPRCVGPRHEVQSFAVFAATALAGLGDLPDTVMSRSIIVRMKKRAPHEHVEPFRSREHEARGHAIRNKLAEWAYVVSGQVGAAWPTLPEGVVDRPAEVWEPLLAVADAAGGSWPERARAACIALVKVAADRRVTLGIRLLADLRTVFGNSDSLPTRTILDQLCNAEQHGLDVDAPWADLHGKPLSECGLATMLKRYDIHSVKVWSGSQDKALQGYRREHLDDAWGRYLAAPSPKEAEDAEGTEGEAGHPLDLPDLPDATGSEGVRCGDCGHFDAGTTFCAVLRQRTQAGRYHYCDDYKGS